MKSHDMKFIWIPQMHERIWNLIHVETFVKILILFAFMFPILGHCVDVSVDEYLFVIM